VKKAYLLEYSTSFGMREAVRDYLNAMPEVTHWRCDMAHSFYLISEASAAELATRLRQLSGGNGRFLVTELPDNKAGWLSKKSWYLMRNKTYLKSEI